VRNAAWNAVVPPNATVTFGFLGNLTGANPAPTVFCAGA